MTVRLATAFGIADRAGPIDVEIRKLSRKQLQCDWRPHSASPTELVPTLKLGNQSETIGPVSSYWLMGSTLCASGYLYPMLVIPGKNSPHSICRL